MEASAEYPAKSQLVICGLVRLLTCSPPSRRRTTPHDAITIPATGDACRMRHGSCCAGTEQQPHGCMARGPIALPDCTAVLLNFIPCASGYGMCPPPVLQLESWWRAELGSSRQQGLAARAHKQCIRILYVVRSYLVQHTHGQSAMSMQMHICMACKACARR